MWDEQERSAYADKGKEDRPSCLLTAGTAPLLTAPFRVNTCSVPSQRERSTQQKLSQHSECLPGTGTGPRKPKRHSSCP